MIAGARPLAGIEVFREQYTNLLAGEKVIKTWHNAERY